MSHRDQEATRLYPELHSLITMREAGWRFHPHINAAGEVTQLDGFRPGPGCTDVLRVRDRADVLGLRLIERRVVWERHGTLHEIVKELLALPLPGGRAEEISRAGGPRIGRESPSIAGDSSHDSW